MKRKIYSSLLLSALTGLAAFGASRPKNQTDGGSLTVPEAWRGTWEVTVTYRDRATGALMATDVTTTAICPGEPIAPPLLDTRPHCAGEATERVIGVSCRAKHLPRPDCNVFVEAGLESQLDGDDWSGNGSWNVNAVGECRHLDFGEDFVVTGRRVSGEATCVRWARARPRRFSCHATLTCCPPAAATLICTTGSERAKVV